MNKQSYYYLNITGLIMILSPLAGMMMSLNPQNVSASIIAGTTAGIPAAGFMFSYLRPRFCTVFLSVISIYSFYLVYFIDHFRDSATWGFILGISACGLIALSPSNMIFEMNFHKKNTMLGTVMSLIILAGLFFSYMFLLYPFASFVTASALILISSVFIIRLPEPSSVAILHDNTDHIRKNRIKLCVYFFFAALSLGLSFQIGYHDTLFLIFSGNASENVLALSLLAGAVSGPLLAVLFSSRKGVYSIAVLLIFLCESAVVCAGFYEQGTIMYAAGHFAFGSALSSLTVICPQIVYHMMGPVSYIKNFCTVSVCLSFGLLSACQPEASGSDTLTSSSSVITSLVLLIISFFTIFSAWKHRFVLLK